MRKLKQPTLFIASMRRILKLIYNRIQNYYKIKTLAHQKHISDLYYQIMRELTSEYSTIEFVLKIFIQKHQISKALPTLFN